MFYKCYKSNKAYRFLNGVYHVDVLRDIMHLGLMRAVLIHRPLESTSALIYLVISKAHGSGVTFVRANIV